MLCFICREKISKLGKGCPFTPCSLCGGKNDHTHEVNDEICAVYKSEVLCNVGMDSGTFTIDDEPDIRVVAELELNRPDPDQTQSGTFAIDDELDIRVVAEHELDCIAEVGPRKLMKRRRSNATVVVETPTNEYELERYKNIQRNNKKLKELGLRNLLF